MFLIHKGLVQGSTFVPVVTCSSRALWGLLSVFTQYDRDLGRGQMTLQALPAEKDSFFFTPFLYDCRCHFPPPLHTHLRACQTVYFPCCHPVLFSAYTASIFLQYCPSIPAECYCRGYVSYTYMRVSEPLLFSVWILCTAH